ncbi:hypothetical protein JXA63_02020 [Candidatus Woesebacteria bacterium]|nr:hypothetical protein [Candidatus Woesebacteria bacterium]
MVDSGNIEIQYTPTVNKELSIAKTEKWKGQFVNLFRDKEQAKAVAEKLLAGLNKISQDQFESELLGVYELARKERLVTLDPKKTRYIYYSGGKHRSAEWVKGLCREYFPDDTILTIPTVDYFDKQLVGEYETGIIIEDASYSGTQVSDHVHFGAERFGMRRFIVVIPFMTNESVSKINQEAIKNDVDVEIFMGRTIKTMREVIGDDDYVWLKERSPTHRIENGQTLTYFDHKVPDYRSFCPYIGNTRHVQVESYLDNLIEQHPAPYHNK